MTIGRHRIMRQSQQPRKVTFASAVGYGMADLYGGGQGALVATYLALFWNRFCGMDIGLTQSVIGMSAILSAFAALGFGVLCDNLYRFRAGRRFGRRRLVLAVVAPLVLVGLLLWIPGLPVPLYCLVYVMWVMLAQLFGTAYSTLPGEMTTDFSERTMLSTVRLFLSTASGTLIPLLGGIVLAAVGENHPGGYMGFAFAVTILFSAAIMICWRSTWEMTPQQAGFGAYAQADGVDRAHGRHHGDVRGTARIWLRRAVAMAREYASTLRIAEFRRHMVVYVMVMVSMDMFGQLFLFFAIYDWGTTAAFASMLLTCAVISLPLMPVFGWAVIAIGPRRLYGINFAGCLIGVAWMFASWMLSGVLTRGMWTVFTIVGAVWFFSFKSLCGYLPWQVFPYMADVDQIVTKRYRSATFLGAQTFVRQLCSGLLSIGAGMVLAAIGFDSQLDTQPPAARIGIGAMLLGWFAFAMAVGWFASQRMGLSKETDGILLNEISRLQHGGSKTEISPETRNTVERLTGISYNDCWRD
jgi:oligogalacturonide transporter